MTQENYKEFCNIMAAAAETVGRQRPSGPALTISFEALKKFSIEQIQAAISAHLSGPNGRFMPTPSHIVEQIEGRPEDRAAVAWALVERLLNAVGGAYESTRFPLPAYHYAIEQLGGWIALGDKYADASPRELQFLSQKFMQFYGIAERSGLDWGGVPEYLVGIFEDERSGRREAKKIRIAQTGVFMPREDFMRSLDHSDEKPVLDAFTPAAALAEAKSCRF